MFWLFNGKKRLEEIKKETKKGFDSVKQDLVSVSGWIKHLDSEKKLQNKEIEDIKEILSSVQEEIDGLKNIISIMNDFNTNSMFKRPSKTNQQVLNKQTSVYPVQTGVQTSVQTPNLSNFSVTERAILFILLNTDMKLSYDDFASMLNKEKSTIRGQINTIKSKSEGLIKEIVEKNGKKRIYIPEEIKEKLLKKQKVRVKTDKKSKKDQEKD
jgi:predicted transcriptional regulator